MKQGDKVIVIERFYGHKFEIGEEVEIIQVREGNGDFVCSNGEVAWYLRENEIEHDRSE